MLILDPTCSVRSIWYQKNPQNVIFTDKRAGKFDYFIQNRKDHTVLKVNPHIVCNWQNLPFTNCSFDMVIFDPPHIIRMENNNGALKEKYGFLLKGKWKQILEQGANELFRVLKENGTFILKWNEVDKPVDEVLKLFPYKPMFGTRTGQRNNTHWILFIKSRQDRTIDEYVR